MTKPAEPITFHLHKALVVGASGFVGKALCKLLKAEGVPVRALIRKEQKGDWKEAVVCDIENFRQHEKKIFHDIDTVFYLASIAHNKAPEDAYQKINVDLCLDFAERALANGVKRFVYVSSTKAMAEPGDKMVDETFTAKPNDKYGLSKRHAEEGLLAMNGFDHLAIVRPSLIYGAGVQGNLYLMMSVIDKDMTPALPDTKARRSMISVNDVDVAGDLKSAVVFISIFGNADQQKRGIQMLNEHRIRIQGLVARDVVLKYTPTLKFVFDDSIVRGNRVLQIMEELEKSAPAGDAEIKP